MNRFGQRDIAFPKVKTFGELFTVDPNAKSCTLTETMTIGTHFSVRSQSSSWFFKVQPTQMVIDFLKESMIFIDYDTITFEAVFRDNGDALIVASYSKIIGGRWLALIPHSEVPTEKNE